MSNYARISADDAYQVRVPIWQRKALIKCSALMEVLLNGPPGSLTTASQTNLLAHCQAGFLAGKVWQ